MFVGGISDIFLLSKKPCYELNPTWIFSGRWNFLCKKTNLYHYHNHYIFYVRLQSKIYNGYLDVVNFFNFPY